MKYKSLFTPSNTSLMGASQSGTDKPYAKVIYDIDIDATLDEIAVTLIIGCVEDDMWTDEEKFTVKHQTFERWLEETDRLVSDDTHHVAAYDGTADEIGEAVAVCYTDYIKEPNQLDMIAYLKAKNEIPDYKIDNQLIQINSI